MTGQLDILSVRFNVAGRAKSDHVEQVVIAIAIVVMVACGWLAAAFAEKLLGTRDITTLSSSPNSLPGFDLLWVSAFVAFCLGSVLALSALGGAVLFLAPGLASLAFLGFEVFLLRVLVAFGLSMTGEYSTAILALFGRALKLSLTGFTIALSSIRGFFTTMKFVERFLLIASLASFSHWALPFSKTALRYVGLRKCQLAQLTRLAEPSIKQIIALLSPRSLKLAEGL